MLETTETTATTPPRAYTRTQIVAGGIPSTFIVSRMRYYPWLAWCEWFQMVTAFLPWFLPWFARGFSEWSGQLSQKQAKPLRQTMPTVAAWVDELREAFGADGINSAIRNGMAGGGQFMAEENGQALGRDALPGRCHVLPGRHGRAAGGEGGAR